MMLTATTRRCKGCGGLLLDAQLACSKCGSVPCVAVEDWPPEVAQWLGAMLLALYFRPMLSHTKQQKAEFLLRSVVAGHQWDTKIVGISAPAVECLPIAAEQALRWSSCGKPREAAEMIELARVRR